MNKILLLTVLLGYLMVSAGMVWKFHEYGLMGSGLVLGVLATVINVKE